MRVNKDFFLELALLDAKAHGVKLHPDNPIREIAVKDNEIHLWLNTVSETITLTFMNVPNPPI